MGGWRWRRRVDDGGDTDRATVTIDLRDAVGPPPPSPEQAAAWRAVAERRRVEAGRHEAERELVQLRARHWSAQRVLEESRLGLDFWAHPLADPYAVLGLLPGDGLEAAAAARRRIARECHPDLTGDLDSVRIDIDRMTAANAAYERLRRAFTS